ADNNSIALRNLKSKVILLQFTSVSCGPCKASIPFLQQLKSEYDLEDFDFVAIETHTKNSNVLKSYQHRNSFDYKFLMSNKETNKHYQVQVVPVFFILDENRIIRNVIHGYGKGTTDKEIRDAINSLI
ncbi:MAG: redoxin family protein, partial [Bacteroidales bacterium]|nr:redoxin family protein [Bacteroidales bacterium]